MMNVKVFTKASKLTSKSMATLHTSSALMRGLFGRLSATNVMPAPSPVVLEESYLSCLLPYDPASKKGDRLKNGLKEYLLLLNATEQALIYLKEEKLHKFDPLVGENACQIRAVKISLVLADCAYDCDRLQTEIKWAKNVIEKQLQLEVWRKNKELSLQDVLNMHSLEISVSEDELYLIKSYLLSVVKTEKPINPEFPLFKSEKTDPKKIKEISDIGSMFADDLVRHLREKLSRSSVDFVQELAAPCPSSSKLVADELAVCHRGLTCLPYFWATKVLMQQALEQDIPIVMLAEQKAKDKDYDVIRKATIVFEPTPQGYKATTACALDPDTPALMLMGTTCRDEEHLPEKGEWIQELLKYSPIDLVLAYAAAHRQYPDPSQDHLIHQIEDKSFNFYREKAKEWGCSADNPSRFFLAHAFCDKIKNISTHI